MARENLPKQKPDIQSPEARLLSGKKALLDQYSSQLEKHEQENNTENNEEIEKLKKEVEQLINDIKALEERVVEQTAQDNPEEAKELDTELAPIIDEAEEIRKQLAELDAEDADIDQKIAELKNKNKKKTKTEKTETKRKKKQETADTNAGNAVVTEPAEEVAERTEEQETIRYTVGTTLEWDNANKETEPKITNPAEGEKDTEDTEAKEEPAIEEVVEQNENVNQQERKTGIEQYGNDPEVIKFIQEFNLENEFPAEFFDLSEEQKSKVIRDLKQRLTTMIQTEALIEYEDELKYNLQGKNMLGRAFTSFIGNIKKESFIKKEEREVLQNYKNKDYLGYREDLYNNAKTLIEITKKQKISRNEKGDLMVDFSDKLNIGKYNVTLIQEYNEAANAFQSLPYEWGQEKEGSKNHLAYVNALNRYREVEADILKIKSYGPDGETGAMIQMSNLKSEILLAQLVNNHPEIDRVFEDLDKQHGTKEVLKTLSRLAGVQSTERTALAVGGYLLRTGTRYAFGFVAAPVVGAVLGGLRAKMRAEESLQSRKKMARLGIQDENKEASRMMDARIAKEKLTRLVSLLGDETDLKQAQELRRRIEFTEQQLERGLVDFGKNEEALAAQYELLQTLNNARIYVAIHETEIDKEVNKRVEALLTYKGLKVEETQKKYIKNQIKKGAMYGVGFATFGYLVRYLTEHGEDAVTEDSAPQENNPDTLKIPSQEEIARANRDIEAERFGSEESAKIDTVKQDASYIRTDSLNKSNVLNINKAPVKLVDTKGQDVGLNAEAIVQKGEGVTFAFKQQIDANPELGKALAKQIGYAGKVGTPDFYKALGEKFGYINEKGEWIGVKGTGADTAYQFEKQGDAYVVNEYHKEGSAWIKGESHAVGGKFEGSDYEKKYEYFGKNKISSNRENASGILKPEKIERASDLPRPQKIEDTSGQFDRAPQRVVDDENGQLARATPENTKTEIKKISSAEYWAKQNGNQKMEASADSDLYGGKKDVKWGVAPGPDGAPWVVEDFTLEGGKAIRLFADRFGYEELTNKEVNFVGETYRYNLNKIFENSKNWTEHYSTMSAPKLLRMDVGDTVKGDREELSTYIKMLYKETGIKPFNDGWVGNKENAKDYILRMLLELEYKGKLDAFNEKFDMFLERNRNK